MYRRLPMSLSGNLIEFNKKLQHCDWPFYTWCTCHGTTHDPKAHFTLWVELKYILIYRHSPPECWGTINWVHQKLFHRKCSFYYFNTLVMPWTMIRPPSKNTTPKVGNTIRFFQIAISGMRLNSSRHFISLSEKKHGYMIKFYSGHFRYAKVFYQSSQESPSGIHISYLKWNHSTH